ncbi:MAG TPA: DUF4129 domain-containing protein [Flavobacteriaceae bacterium]|nr:DUF4129 domain-containing protein [Flavobacteriaceae bacterium]
MRFVFCVIVIFGLACFQMTAQPTNDSASTAQEIRTDQNQEIQPVQIDVEQFEKFKEDKAFDYAEKENPENWWQSFKSWLSSLWRSFWEGLVGDIQPGNWFFNAMEFLKYILIIGLIGFAIWLFNRLNTSRALMKPATSPEVLLSDEEKIMRSEDIPKLIEQAQAEQNYRLAVRYSYLLILKILKDKNLIDYQYQKTNQEYQYELKQDEMAVQFDVITRLYEFIWYGDFKPTQLQYQQAKKEFDNIEEQLNSPRYV